MKEKITKAEFINTWASEWDENTGWKVNENFHKQFSEELEQLISQEVEKRIAERMPTGIDVALEIKKWVEDEPARGYCIYAFHAGVDWLRSRMTNTKDGRR